MLQSEQVKPFILHPDILVSNAALAYFADSFIYDEDLMPLVLEKFKRVGKNEKLHLFYAKHFTQTADTVSETLALLQSPELNIEKKLLLGQILVNSGAELLRNRIDEIEAAFKHVTPQAMTVIDAADLTDDELWDGFEDFFMGCSGKYMNEIDTFHGDVLIRELARRRSIEPEFILQTLKTHDFDDMEGYETIFIAQLAGEMRIESAVPVLCDFLSTKDEVLQGQAATALIRIGTAEVVRELSERYVRDDDNFFRLYASDIFGKIKLHESEEALLRLLPLEQDVGYATVLADGLCGLCSAKGVPAVHKRISEGYDEDYLDLRESLYANCIMNGIPLPEAEQWKKKFVQMEQDRQARAARFENLSPPVSSASRAKPVKVGRNDPCPCGSGKKYKKCCGQ